MAMDVTLRQLRAFVAVLDAVSFSEAAKAMQAGWQAGMKIERSDAIRW